MAMFPNFKHNIHKILLKIKCCFEESLYIDVIQRLFDYFDFPLLYGHVEKDLVSSFKYDIHSKSEIINTTKSNGINKKLIINEKTFF